MVEYIFYFYCVLQDMKKNQQPMFRRVIVFLSSFPGFFLPIALYTLLVYDLRGISIFFVALSLLTLIHIFIKYIFPTPRPVWYTDDNMFHRPWDTSSFPSNHTGAAFLLYFFVQANVPQYGVLFLLFALVVALSRLYLHKHHPVDIIGGFVIAYVVFIVVQLLAISYYFSH